ncbi:MAG: Mobile element protein, partial [uncultured Thermomicrobiales bacterium]
PHRRAGVARDRPHRHAQGLRQPGAAGSGGAQARSLERPPVLLSRPPRRSVEGDLARRTGSMPVHQKAGARALPVAEPGRRGGDDLLRPTRLPALGHRLALSARDLASHVDRL